MANNGIPKDFSMEKAKEYLASPAGKQLAALLQNTRDPGLAAAAAQASAGNMEGAKAAVESLLKDPKICSLLNQFGGNHGGN